MMKRLNLIHVAVALALTGCMVGPDYQRPDTKLPGSFSDASESKDVSEATLNADRWWETFQDPVLNDIMQKAFAGNLDIAKAVARIEEADAAMREAGAALFPQVDLTGNGLRQKVTETGAFPIFSGVPVIRETYNLQLGTSFELDFWGRLRRARESARAQALGTYFAKDTVSLSLSGLVASNYLLLRSLEAQIAISRDSLHSRGESLALTKRRLDGGVASILDVHQAEVANSNLVAQIADLVRQREIVQHQLAVLTGDLELKVPEGDIHQLPLPPVPPSGLPSALLAARPDIRQAEQDLISQNAQIGVAKAAMFPTISLTANYGGESADLNRILESPSRIWSLGLGLNLPIFNAGRLSARVDQATAKQKQVLATYQSSVQTAFKEVKDALVTVRQSREREDALNTSQDSAKKALQISENRYKSGYSAYLDVLDSQRVYNDAALAFIQSRQARLTATVDLFKALGGGWKTAEAYNNASNEVKP
ncbi:efflux transporter outer membrane subunit [Methylobacillus gramineus]|uniref:efflux transporter outer membrane subunit n=1 Tax=Methylobacillus gramineus TaxID=755169 RepID=UPI001CFFCDC8|nr:efflux transporter outer membrane subunit [Methylobacillus gramineus]MCB5184176.1 efflux transporter outer membrane subunit [Methylobacillus gramineus]